MVSGAASGMCELTNQSRLGTQEGVLKETGAFQTEYSTAALDSLKKRMSFLSIQACKSILVVTQNKIRNVKKSKMCLNKVLNISLSVTSWGIKCSLTFELDLQHLIGILDDVTIRSESVTGTMHTDLQAKIGLWGGNKSRGM